MSPCGYTFIKEAALAKISQEDMMRWSEIKKLKRKMLETYINNNDKIQLYARKTVTIRIRSLGMRTGGMRTGVALETAV